MSDRVYLSAPIAKTVETEDGGREVWGFATLEVVDKAGEIADFDGTVQEFEKWSSEVEKRTNGKSKGNVRVMHQPVVAGKTIHWEPSEATVDKEDGTKETVKAIWVGAYIPPTKPDVIKDVDEGILSGLSIGGSYKKRWWDDTAKAFRFIPELSEYSLVDNPCVPGADIVNVFSKSVPSVVYDTEMELEKSTPAGSYEELQEKIRRCLDGTTPWGYFDGWIVGTYPDKFIVYDYNSGNYFEYPYTQDEHGCINIGTQKIVELQYIPKESQKFVEDQIAKKVTNSHKSPPEGKPQDSSEYADPKNFKYPIDAEHIHAAVSYFNHDGQREAGGYTTEEWDEIGHRIASAATRLEGGEYKYEEGKITTPTESEKGSDKTVNPEDIAKAAEAAGLSLEQIQSFFKALTPIDQPPAPASVDVVDGDGDKDENKEFPNPPDSKDKIDIETGQNDVKEAEKESGVASEKIADVPGQNPGNPVKEAPFKTDEVGDLAKAGKAVSKARLVHMKHAMNHIKAAMDGTEYGPEHHVLLENEEAGQGNTGEESPPATEKSFTSTLAKSVSEMMNDQMTKTINKFESLVKGLANAETLTKALDRLSTLETLVKEIHETPQVGGPVLNGGSPDIALSFSKSAGNVDVKALEEQALENFVKTTTDPLVRDRIGQELAIRRAKNVLR